MVAHHDPGVNPPARLFAALGQRFEPKFPVLVIGTNFAALVPARHDAFAAAAKPGAKEDGKRPRRIEFESR